MCRLIKLIGYELLAVCPSILLGGGLTYLLEDTKYLDFILTGYLIVIVVALSYIKNAEEMTGEDKLNAFIFSAFVYVLLGVFIGCIADKCMCDLIIYHGCIILVTLITEFCSAKSLKNILK